MLGCSLSPRRRGISAGLGMDAIARLVDHVVITVHRINQADAMVVSHPPSVLLLSWARARISSP